MLASETAWMLAVEWAGEPASTRERRDIRWQITHPKASEMRKLIRSPERPQPCSCPPPQWRTRAITRSPTRASTKVTKPPEPRILAGSQGPKGDTGPAGATCRNGQNGAEGPARRNGQNGHSYLQGAYYSVAGYDVGDTNGGAIFRGRAPGHRDSQASQGRAIRLRHSQGWCTRPRMSLDDVLERDHPLRQIKEP